MTSNQLYAALEPLVDRSTEWTPELGAVLKQRGLQLTRDWELVDMVVFRIKKQLLVREASPRVDFGAGPLGWFMDVMAAVVQWVMGASG